MQKLLNTLNPSKPFHDADAKKCTCNGLKLESTGCQEKKVDCNFF